MGVACSPEDLSQVVLGVLRIAYEQREDAGSADLDRGNEDQEDASDQARLWAHEAPFLLILGATTRKVLHEGGGAAPCRGVCSCSTTSSRTCSRPTSSSSMLRRSILPRFTASARIAKAPIATAPTAVAPTANAPSPTAPIV